MRRNKFLLYLFLFILCLVVYSNCLNNDFIFDDQFIIIDNAYIKNPAFIPRLFQTDIFHFQHSADKSLGVYYRPMQALTHALDYALWKLNPAGYRLFNILLHSLNSFLLYLLVYLLFQHRVLALLSALIFCIHPIQVSDVALISVRAVPLELAFMLLSLLAILHYFLGARSITYFLSLFLFILALLSREDALLLPLFILLSALVLGVKKKRVLLGVIPFILLALMYIALRYKFIPCDKLYFSNTLTVANIKDLLWYLLEYGRQLLMPVSAGQFILGNSSIGGFILFVFSFLLLSLSLIRAAFFRNKKFIFGLGFYFIGLLPVTKLGDNIRTLTPILAEHYVYIASVGFFVLMSCFLMDSQRYLHGAVYIFILAGLFVYSALTMVSNTKYKDEVTFYRHILSLDPGHILVRVNLGTAYYKKKMYKEAKAEARAVLAANPWAWDAHLLLGNVFREEGSLDEAAGEYKRAITLNPRSSAALNNLGLIYQAQGKNEDALVYLSRAVEIDPEAVWAWRNLIDLLIEKRSYSDAMLLCERALKSNPDDTGIQVRIAIILGEQGYFQKSEEVFHRALKLDPFSVEAMRNLGVLYANRGDLDKAISLWEKALSLNPDDEKTRDNLKEATRLKGPTHR